LGARLWIVTRGAQAISGQARPLQLAQAPAWGFGRVMALEHPELWGGLIDLDPLSETGAGDRLFDVLRQATVEDQMALRAGTCFVPRVVHAELPAARPSNFAGGAFLITGGLGALGLKTAEWLAERGAGTVVLLGRRALPGREQWSSFDADHPARAQIDMVRRIEHHGASVRIVQADVCDASRMREVFDEMSRVDPPLKGIVHAAGTSSPRSIRDLDAAALDEVLAAKTRGAWILHELSRDIPLDFFVCYSSIASVWGSAGLAHYAAANHFLDALARHRRALGLAGLSLNWGRLWLRGMVSGDAEQWLDASGVKPLSEPEAAGAFDRVLLCDVPQAIIARIDWPTFKTLYEARGPRPLLARVGLAKTVAAPVTASSGLGMQLRRAEPADRLRLLQSALAEWVARVLRLPAAEVVGVPLSRLGLDSLMALELRNRVQIETGVELPLVMLVQGPSVEELVSAVSAGFDALPAEPAAEGGGASSPDEALERLDHLSDADVDALLRQMLEERQP
jgi:NAD(P)-dependent dehydrogenase (short-subunit alcohol dehydrogenase family)/acyl carrier protein